MPVSAPRRIGIRLALPRDWVWSDASRRRALPDEGAGGWCVAGRIPAETRTLSTATSHPFMGRGRRRRSPPRRSPPEPTAAMAPPGWHGPRARDPMLGPRGQLISRRRIIMRHSAG